MKTIRRISLTMVVLMFLVATGCSSPESTVVGKWTSKTGSIEFFKDKTGIINPPANTPDLPSNVRFNWSIQGNDTVQMVLEPPSGKQVSGKLQGKKVLIIELDTFEKQ